MNLCKAVSAPSLTIGDRTYVLSDYAPRLMGESREASPEGGAKLIMGDPRFIFFWAYDTEKKRVAMWRASDGSQKDSGTANEFVSEVLALDRKGQLNRVTHDEFVAIERHMRGATDDTMAAMKAYLEANATDWDRQAKSLAIELFEERFQPQILAKFKEVDSGVIPFGFKVRTQFLSHRSAQAQAKMWVTEQVAKGFSLQALDDFARSKGYDPDNPPGDCQALDWGRKDVLNEFYEKFFP